jgi:acetyl-CoA acetyltransferase
MEKYGVTSRHLAMVAVKNHQHAMDNFYAHIHEPITIEGILDSRKPRPIIRM